jgi:predicted DNA-binding transcriptional regulator YafY
MTRAHAQLRRLYWIDAALQRDEYPNATELARELGVSRGTLHRDLQTLREQHRAPLTFDPTKNGYGYGHPFRPELPQLPAEEAIGLATAILARGQLAESALGDALRRLREELADLLPAGDPTLSARAAVTGGSATMAGAAPTRTLPERPAPRPGASRRTVPPGGRGSGPGVGSGTNSGAASRAKAGSGPGDPIAVLVRFDPAATRAVLDCGFFAPREVQLLTNGGFEATVTTTDPDAFLLSLLQWAPHFVIAGPPWARRRLPQLLRRLVRQLEDRKSRRRKR